MNTSNTTCLVNGNKGKIGSARLKQIVSESEEIDTRLNSFIRDYEQPLKSNQSRSEISGRNEACVEYGRILSQAVRILSHETLLGIRRVLDSDLSKAQDQSVDGFDQNEYNEQITSKEIEELSNRIQNFKNWLEDF
jgi:hypothetical protein